MTAIHARRREGVAALLSAREADAILVSRAVNVRYLTGLVSSNAAVLVRADATAVLATDSRYAETARAVCEGVEVVEERDVAAALVSRASRVAVEAHHMPVADYFRLGEGLLRTTGLVESVRTVKDETEIDLLRTACAITDQAFADVLPMLRPGLTEREIARVLEARMAELGADKPAFDTIVAGGPNGSVPHHSPADRPLERGDLVTMDFGAMYAGYHADMTRTVAIGEPASWQRELYDLVRAAQRAGRHAVRPGAATHEVDAAARDVITEAGYGGHFGHGLGHGVGLEIHEEPFLFPVTPEPRREHGRLDDRVPVTVEPGVYLQGRGGVRIEDTLVTREDGPELLTRTTKELLVL
ncbi:M24 family metallopeptidase [Planobispora siamensis]|uniref:X-Pro dipeptidase n=1 Tax=Planobispora siamensis TaxID=936338 RepID=A0A8J3SQ54_9ACTN|nr:aminopeptidase P family protein [Planobispora siamensis]GIH96726.1 X-Pro dipeptidase [Planobispora siamensis]